MTEHAMAARRTTMNFPSIFYDEVGEEDELVSFCCCCSLILDLDGLSLILELKFSLFIY